MEPVLFEFEDLLVDALDLELVLVYFRLSLRNLILNILILLLPLFELVLVFAQLLCHCWPCLLGEDILQFDIQFFLLLDEDVLFSHFL